MTPRISFSPYRLPLRRPWRSAHGPRTERCGWLVRAELDGRSGYGDCAPLPEAGTESAAAAHRRLEDWVRRSGSLCLEEQLAMLAGTAGSRACSAARRAPFAAFGAPSDPGRLTTPRGTEAEVVAGARLAGRAVVPSATPAADAALETALLDLDARLQGVTLRARLLQCGPSRTLAPPLSVIRVNAVLGAVTEHRPEVLAEALAAGFDLLKLKVGVAPLADELAALRELCDRLPPAVRLRLDANQAWSPTEAQHLVDAVEPFGERIESLEEPLRPHAESHTGPHTGSHLERRPESRWRDAALGALQARAAFSIALDESLPAREWPQTLDDLPVRRLVLKPAVLGGLRPTLNLARSAQALGREVVITSLIESAAGVWSSAQLAAATGSRLSHGLATSDWLDADLGEPPKIARGQLRLPEAAGSGFNPRPPSMHSGDA